MDITAQDNTIQPISDDQELAKALAGVLPDAPESELKFEESPIITTTAAPLEPQAPIQAPVETTSVPSFENTTAPTLGSFGGSEDLEGIKSQALSELRPLIDRVDLPSEDRFDAYLMLLRSTDDSTLVAPAHAAAQGIADEKRKAEALLEIIKEIDYLSRKNTPSA